MSDERAAVKEQKALLASKEVTAAAHQLPSDRYVENVKKAMQKREADDAQREAFLKLLTKATTDLEGLAKALG